MLLNYYFFKENSEKIFFSKKKKKKKGEKKRGKKEKTWGGRSLPKTEEQISQQYVSKPLLTTPNIVAKKPLAVDNQQNHPEQQMAPTSCCIISKTIPESISKPPLDSNAT
jgi:hypothetical protein